MGRAFMGPLGPLRDGPLWARPLWAGPLWAKPLWATWTLMVPSLNLIDSIDFQGNCINMYSVKLLCHLPYGTADGQKPIISVTEMIWAPCCSNHFTLIPSLYRGDTLQVPCCNSQY